MTDDRLALIECLERVCEHGSLAAAARVMNLTTAAVSLRVGRLERRLGVQLLERHSRGVRLTPAGQRYCARSAELRRQLDELDDDLAARGHDVEGEIRLDVSSSLAHSLLLEELAAYLKSYPKLHIHLQTMDAYRNDELESADLVIRIGSLAETSKVARKIAVNHRVLVASPEYVTRHGHPAHPEEIMRHRAVALSWQQGFWLRGPNDARVQIRLPRALTCNDGRTLTQLASLGVGIALKSTWDVAEQLQSGELVRILPDWEEGSRRFLYVLLPGRRYQPARVRKLLEFLIHRLRARVATIDAALRLEPAIAHR